ncbi:MAG: hypothetical protein JWN11_2168 [Hyphomicrobiales bacterium]|nr:hypothetical protein [Hyphomicrobiales bacterium]
MNDLFAALALAITIEGLLYAAFPEPMKKLLASILSMPAANIRAAGLTCAGAGLVLLWFIRG